MPAGPATGVAAVVLAVLSVIGIVTSPEAGEPLPAVRPCPESSHPPAAECCDAAPCPVCASSADVAAAAEAAVAPVRAELAAARVDGVWLRVGAFVTSVVFSFFGGLCVHAFAPARAPVIGPLETPVSRADAELVKSRRPVESPAPT